MNADDVRDSLLHRRSTLTILRNCLVGALGLVIFSAPLEAAVQIAVDPGSYVGTWRIDGSTSTLTGSQTVTVEPGNNLAVRAGGSGGVGVFLIDVDAAGFVTVQNGASAQGGAGTLTFNTTPLTVNPGSAYQGTWRISGVQNSVSGMQTIEVVPAVTYGVGIGGSGGVGVFFIAVDAAGFVTVQNGVSAQGGAGTVAFNTTPLTVDPGPAYQGTWRIGGVQNSVSGIQTLEVVPAVTYGVGVGGSGGVGVFFIAVDVDGFVTVQNDVSAAGGAGTVTFNTTPLTVDPGPAYQGTWRIGGVQTSVTGVRTLDVVPAVTYGVGAGGSGGVGVFFIAVDAAGFVTVQNGVSGQGGPGTLILNTTTINVATSSPDGWRISGINSQPIVGSATLALVPSVSYAIGPSGGSVIFVVAEPCAVSPTQFQLGGFTFNVTCGVPDTDDDGVPDDTDNCPLVPNFDQVDQDLDDVGNVCDADLDGDDVPNLGDNCPNIANADQADLDGDGEGDACETDTDGDSVPDSSDNCVLLPNTGQGDSDGDSLGDACDVDDDNDGIQDPIDNCPLSANPGQEDFNGNGQGDVCDGDVDGDGVANGVDLCRLSPLGETVNANGCTGPQYVAAQCWAGNFVQHGQYVSCVAHAVNDAVSQGLLTPKEKARFVKEAAKSK